MKKLLFLSALLLPGLAHADRLGSLKSSVDVPLSTNTILNNTGSAENKTINVTSATIAGRLTVLDTSENKFIKHYSNTAFGPAGMVTQVKTEEQFGTGGAYRIIVSTSEAVSLSNVTGQSSVVLTPPSASGTASYVVYLNGNAAWIVDPSTTTIDSDVNITGDMLIGENATNTLTVTGPLISQDTIATETGGISFQGSTITVNAPPIDTLDRVPILNNGVLDFPLMANGASIDAYNNFTSSNVFSSTLTITSALDCSGYIDDGMVCWDMDDDTFYIGNGASAQEIGASASLSTDANTIYLEDPVAADDLQTLWVAPVAVTITSISCESDQTVNFDLQVDDGSATGVNGSDIACTTFATDSSLGGDTTLAAGDRLDLAVASVSGTPTWVSITYTYTKD